MVFSLVTLLGIKEQSSKLGFINLSRNGISMKQFKKIVQFTQLSNKEMSEILPISERQLSRYKDDHLLRKDISSHLIQLLQLFNSGYEIFGKEKFQIWVRSQNKVLGTLKPIEILDTSIGIEMIENILGRIEHGVYS